MNKSVIQRLKDKKGMTIGELMVATLILLLVTAGITTGMQLALSQYDKSMTQSESKILCSTLESVITNELSNTKSIQLGDVIPEGQDYAGCKKLVGFFSKHYAKKDTGEYSSFYSVKVNNNATYDDTVEYGELLLGNKNGGVLSGNLLINSAAYSTYKLGAKTDVVYDTSKNLFHVTLSVTGLDEPDVFDVMPLNTPTIDGANPTPDPSADPDESPVYKVNFMNGSTRVATGEIKAQSGEDPIFKLTVDGDISNVSYGLPDGSWKFLGWYYANRNPAKEDLNAAVNNAYELITHFGDSKEINLYAGFENETSLYVQSELEEFHLNGDYTNIIIASDTSSDESAAPKSCYALSGNGSIGRTEVTVYSDGIYKKEHDDTGVELDDFGTGYITSTEAVSKCVDTISRNGHTTYSRGIIWYTDGDNHIRMEATQGGDNISFWYLDEGDGNLALSSSGLFDHRRWKYNNHHLVGTWRWNFIFHFDIVDYMYYYDGFGLYRGVLGSGSYPVYVYAEKKPGTLLSFNKAL